MMENAEICLLREPEVGEAKALEKQISAPERDMELYRQNFSLSPSSSSKDSDFRCFNKKASLPNVCKKIS